METVKHTRLLPFLAVVILSNGCDSKEDADGQLRTLIENQSLNGEFIRDSAPASKALLDLGGTLFFSPDLSIDGTVSCASCHHPLKGGADGVALPIGIGGADSNNVGQQRIDAAAKNPDIDVANGLIPRNSLTVFNSSLYLTTLFWDGRVGYAGQGEEKEVVAGFGGGRFNLEGHQQSNLLQAQARMPLSSAFEMKGALAPTKNNHEIESAILEFLTRQSSWCEGFTAVYPGGCSEAITLKNLTAALSAYQSSLVFVDSVFEQYIRGEKSALTNQQKRGALLFYGAVDGVPSCAACHSGKHFSDELFYNLAIPASGIGKNNDGWDFGRSNVDKHADKFRFRTPGLLNVEHTAPYFHNGVAATLEDAIAMHQQDARFRPAANRTLINGVNYAAVDKAIIAAFEDDTVTRKLLPRQFDTDQLVDLSAFLKALSDPCLNEDACMARVSYEVVAHARIPDRPIRPMLEKKRVVNWESVNKPSIHFLPGTTKKLSTDGTVKFYLKQKDIGLSHSRKIGEIKKGWLVDVVNYSGVSAVDVDYDGLDDLIFDGGGGKMKFYRQLPSGQFVPQDLPFTAAAGGVNPLIMDVDGDYKMDLFVGSLGKNPAYIAFDFMHSDDVMRLESLTGPVINASAADIDADGDLDLGFAFWRSFDSLKQPLLWINDGHGNLSSFAQTIRLRESQRTMGGGVDVKRLSRAGIKSLGVADRSFTLNFADIDNDGDQDLLLASDFLRSQVLRNNDGSFEDVTDKNVIDDNNGMGAAIGDFNNDSLIDWFVTSIVDSDFPMLHGHRYYQNLGQGRFTQHEVDNKSVEWSWAACAKDFNNDGYEDVFYISGYGEAMPSAEYASDELKQQNIKFLQNYKKFSGSRPTLLINDGKGAFSDQSLQYGFGQVLDGRGISCFDYQQDGDIDIVVAPLEGTPVLFENQGNQQHWIALRLLGLPGNTEAIGARLMIETSRGIQYRQVRFENNYISRNPAQQHVGLGQDKMIKSLWLELPAPIGQRIELKGLAIDRLHVIDVGRLLEGINEMNHPRPCC